METLDLSKCTTNEEVSKLIQVHVRGFDLIELTKKLSERFVFQEQAIRKVYAALSLGKNAILYGPGGFGKTEIVKAICNEMGIPMICKVGYKDMMPEELLGIPNMTMLLEQSKYETAFENSVFCIPGILVLEEFFDCDPSTAAALKDVLTERGMREGSIKKESLISSVIITGNKDPKELGIDDSTKAFYLDRFPFRHEAVWSSYTEQDYMKFYRAFYGDNFKVNKKKLLLCARLCASTEERISPRTASDTGDTAIHMGVSFLDTLESLDTSMLKEISRNLDEETNFLDEEELLNKVKAELNIIVKSITSSSIGQLENDKYLLNLFKEELINQDFSNQSMEALFEANTIIDFGLGLIEDEINKKIPVQEVINRVKNIFYDNPDN